MLTKRDLKCSLYKSMKGWAKGVLRQRGNHTAMNSSNKLLTIFTLWYCLSFCSSQNDSGISEVKIFLPLKTNAVIENSLIIFFITKNDIVHNNLQTPEFSCFI